MAEDSTVKGAGSGGGGRWRLLLPLLLLIAVGGYAIYSVRPVGPDEAGPERTDTPQTDDTVTGEERAARAEDSVPAAAPVVVTDVPGGQPAPAPVEGTEAPGALPPGPDAAVPGALTATADAGRDAPAVTDDPETRRRALSAAGDETAEDAQASDDSSQGEPPAEPETTTAREATPPDTSTAAAPESENVPAEPEPGDLPAEPLARDATAAPDTPADDEGAPAEAVAEPDETTETPAEEAGLAETATEPGAEATAAGAEPAAEAAPPPAAGELETALLAPEPSAAPGAAAPRTPADGEPPRRASAEPERVPPPTPGDVTAPSFDIVRIDAGGSGLVAGRAEPGATVKVMAGDLVLATVEAGRGGEFVAFVQIPAGDEGQILKLLAETGQAAAESAEDILVLPPPPAADAPEAPEAAPVIVRADPSTETVRVERPSGLGKVDGVTLDAISYDEAGEVKLSGRAPGAQPIRIYLNDTPAAETRASEAGLWEARVEGIAEGRYMLRVDALNEDGSVASRAESPFQRVYPTAEQRAQPSRIIVQPGNTLWVMARERYGRGILYTQIYLANQGAIRDPDLIYPGQIFDIPEEDEFVR